MPLITLEVVYVTLYCDGKGKQSSVYRVASKELSALAWQRIDYTLGAVSASNLTWSLQKRLKITYSTWKPVSDVENYTPLGPILKMSFSLWVYLLLPSTCREERRSTRKSQRHVYRGGKVLFGVYFGACASCCLHGREFNVREHKLFSFWNNFIMNPFPVLPETAIWITSLCRCLSPYASRSVL